MQAITLKLAGLYLHPNAQSEVPQGALSVADNIVINRESVAEPRRGIDVLSGGFASNTDRANALFFFQNRLLAHYATNKLAYYNGSAWVNYSTTHTPPSNPDTASAFTTLRVRSAEANQNLYFTTASGIYRLDSVTGTPAPAGAYKALDLQAAISSTATAAWLPTNYAVAYRIVWGFKDANNKVIFGSPSQRAVIKNTGAINDVTLTFTVPDGVTTSWFFQIYRSASVDNSTADIEPNDELGLVYEGNPTALQITNKLVSVVDITPDDLRGATIYTAATQEGLVNQNEPPPFALDVAVFKNRLWFGNTKSKFRYSLSLLAAGAPSGVQVGDTITIQILASNGTVASSLAYTGAAAENIASRQFKVFTGGSASQNIRDTADSLVRVINRHSGSQVNAYYLSGPDDLPGKILFEEESIGGFGFAVISSRAGCWSPNLPSSGTAEKAVNDAQKNGIAYSKESRPDAVPLPNRFLAGSADKDILRIIALRDYLFVFKDDGIYRISGTDDDSFRCDLEAPTRLIAPETAVVLNNIIYALTDQGVAEISDGGVKVRSRPIESTLLELQGDDLDALRNISFAVAYETERKYILFVPRVAGETSPSQAYVYNIFTNSWTRWPMAKRCGGVDPYTDKLYLAPSDSNLINVERKTFSYRDYADYKATTTISTIVDKVVTLSGTDGIVPGDLILRDGKYAVVESVDSISGTVTTTFAPSFTAGAGQIAAPVSSRLQWVPFSFGNPGVLKQFREASLLFKADFAGRAFLTFTSDISEAKEVETITGAGTSPWGWSPWGLSLWGGNPSRRPARVYVPRNKQRCTQLTVEFSHGVAYTTYQLIGISLIANSVSERVIR